MYTYPLHRYSSLSLPSGCSPRRSSPYSQTVSIQRGHEHTRRRKWSKGGLEQASEGQEALWPPVLNARRIHTTLFTPNAGALLMESRIHTYAIHRRFIFKGNTSTHAQGTELGGGASRASKGQEALWPPVLNARRIHTTLFTPNAGALLMESRVHTYAIHRRFIFKGNTSTHAQRTELGGGG